ncbi:hypothetical protein LPBF_04995 [Flavobacterium crassostreae]|uniref:Signal peptidase n=1 Tax=Flavobacterium crassostreae TaxID=1763534 RepID=A0A1B9E655_9FLAO|nr:hypothetical protein LPBF_04995 [Flavobacterium crassostreae]
MKKIFKNNYLLLAFAVISLGVFAAPEPPPPGVKGSSAFPPPPPPPGLPINKELVFLLVAGVALGKYTTYKYIKTKKTSV